MQIGAIMKQKILKIYKEMGSKHFSRRVKKTPALWNWVLQQTPFLEDDISASERIYAAINNIIPICYQNNRMKFKSFDEGYGFCGPAGKCECARKSVSEKVSATKQLYTEEQTAAINAKRVQTTLEKHGVTNNGQTPQAIVGHKTFYSNPEKVKKQVEKQKATLQENHGDHIENARDIPGVQDKIDRTNFERTGYVNPRQNPETIEKFMKTSLERYGYDHPMKHPQKRAEMSKRKRIIENQDGFKVYTAQINRWTRDVKKIYEGQGYTFGAKNDDYQLDHFIPKVQGFVLGIPPWILGSKYNIRLITGLENKSKGGAFQPQELVDMIIENYFKEK